MNHKQLLTDEEVDEIVQRAFIRYRKYIYGPKGQQLSPKDNPEWHIVRETERATLEKINER